MWSQISSADALAALPHSLDGDDEMTVPEVQRHLPKPRPLRPTIFPLHPILLATPLSSPVLSRRSSSAGSCISSKSVRFPCNDHDLSTYQFTHSRENYDRSPIIPSCEDLEIPSCKKSGSGGWIRCLQRKAKEASEAGQAPPFISSVFSGDLNHPCASSGSVASSEAPSDLPSLVHDDCSSSSESDDHFSPTTFTPPSDGSHGLAITSAQLSSTMFCESLMTSNRSFCWDTMRPSESDTYEDDGIASDEDEHETIRSQAVPFQASQQEQVIEEDEVSDACDSDDDDAAASDVEEEGRMGMCGLGKFSRSSLYAEDDALGGF